MKGFLAFPLVILLGFSLHSANAKIWILTNLTSQWQGQTYWQFPLNYTSGAINTYHLQLSPGTATPGTISIFTNSNSYSLPDVYVSTTCATVQSCQVQTSMPTSEHNCWNANQGNNSIWQMNVMSTSQTCDLYLGIISNPNNVTVSFAYLPQFQISASQNYTSVPIYWTGQGEQFYQYNLPQQFAQTTNARFTVNFKQISSQVVSGMYIGSNDTRFLQLPCNYTFPAQNKTCFRTSTPYTASGITYYSYQTFLNSANSKVILGFITNQNGGQSSFSLYSTVTMGCNQGYIQSGNNCVLQNASSLTNASSTLQPSNQKFWNISLVPGSAGAALTYSLDLTNSNVPGTFYLNSPSSLPNVYVSTDCNSTTKCLYPPTATPSSSAYCFTQNASSNVFQMNNLPASNPSTTNGCKYYFTFPNAGSTMNINMEYFPIQNISDYSQVQYFYIPWGSAIMPRYFIYELPYRYRTISPSKLKSFTVTIADVNENLISNVYFSTNDPMGGTSCKLTSFPDSNTNCPILSSAKINGTGNFYTYSFHLQQYSSLNYLAFYVKQNNSIDYLNATITSQVNCISNYMYSQEAGDCIAITTVPLTQNFTQYGNQRYWNVQPAIQQGMTNIFSLNLETSDEPGTFYVGSAIQNQDMPNIYISTNCSSDCSTYTPTPSYKQQCWNTSSFTQQKLTTFFNVNPKKYCQTYFSLEDAKGTEKIVIAYFPISFPIQASASNQTLLFPWQIYPAPRYILPQINYAQMQHATFTEKFLMYTTNLLNVSQTPSLNNHTIYLASKDPQICSGDFNELFPGPQGGCTQIGISKSIVNGTQVDTLVYHLEYETSGVQMAIYGQSSPADPQLTFTYSTEFHCVSPAVLQQGTCVIYQPPTITNLTSQVSNSSKGNFWNLNLTTTGSAQVFELDLTTDNLPGAFYWSQNQNGIYPTVYVVTNCVSSCNFNSSQEASTTNYCAQTPSGSANAWSLTTDDNINTKCYLQFYLEASTESSFSFMYYPETLVSDGNNTEAFNWSPQLFRYFKYQFSNTYQQIPYAQFNFAITIPINNTASALYFGTNDPYSQCNYSLPNSGQQCQDIYQTTTNVSKIYQLVVNSSNSTIYMAMASNSSQQLTFTITPSFTCYTGYYQPTGQMTCKIKGNCDAGSYFDDTKNQCVQCSTVLSNCALCVSSTTCTECTNNQFTITGGKCVAVCPSGEYPNPAITTAQSSVCLPCMQHCVKCTSASDCSECYEPTYVWSATNKNCSTVCPKGGQYYDATTKQCIDCEVKLCLVCYGAGLQCNGCQDGYHPVQLQNGNIECQKIEQKPKAASLLGISFITLLLLAVVMFLSN